MFSLGSLVPLNDFFTWLFYECFILTSSGLLKKDKFISKFYCQKFSEVLLIFLHNWQNSWGICHHGASILTWLLWSMLLPNKICFLQTDEYSSSEIHQRMSIHRTFLKISWSFKGCFVHNRTRLRLPEAVRGK